MRFVTASQNNMNRLANKNNPTGVKGVRKHAACDMFIAEIKPSPAEKAIYLGLYRTVAEAKAAYDSTAEKYHGEFRRNP
jgi:hypothetical protein